LAVVVFLVGFWVRIWRIWNTPYGSAVTCTDRAGTENSSGLGHAVRGFTRQRHLRWRHGDKERGCE